MSVGIFFSTVSKSPRNRCLPKRFVGKSDWVKLCAAASMALSLMSDPKMRYSTIILHKGQKRQVTLHIYDGGFTQFVNPL